MKTKRFKFLIVSVILLAAVGFISGAIAAPGPAPAENLQAAPMAALPEVTCTLVDTTRTCELWARTGDLMLPGATLPVPVWGFANPLTGEAIVPGPVIRAQVGETLEIILHNEVPGESVSLAFPGQEAIPDLNGVATGSAATYSFPVTKTGTFLYEAGLTSGGARQVAMGLYGALVIEDPNATPDWDQELVMVFSEVDPAFNTDVLDFSMIHFKPKYWLINGQAWPDTGYVPVAAESTVLLRYLNAGVEHRTIGLLGLNQAVVAVNGESLFAPHGAVAEPLAPGETKEVLVNVPLAPDGTLYALYNASLHQHNNNQRLADGRAAFGGMLTFLQVAGEPPTTSAGPVASNVTVAPSKTDGNDNVIFSATLSDPDGVAAAEYFVDLFGAPGSGTAVVPDSTGYVEVTFTPTDLAGWTSGEHTLYIRGQDSLTTWGDPGSAVLYLDKTGPSISGLSLNPNPTNGSVDVLLSATADDRPNGNSLVVAAEYSLDDGTTWLPMTLSATGTSVKALSATILAADVVAPGEGPHPVMVRAQDEWGNLTDPAGVINLNVDMTGPIVTAITLDPNALDFNQPLPVTAVRLTATVEDALSALVNAEGFIDAVGDPGTGFDLYPADGLFDEPVEDVYYDIPVSHFSTLPDGAHTVHVTGRDKAGNWGPAGSAQITITAAVVDNTKPVVSALEIQPDKGNKILLTGLAQDDLSNIDSAVWYLTSDPGTYYPMSASDGAFDSLSESIEASININKWPSGPNEIGVIAMDASGIWSDPATIIFNK